MAVRPDRPPPDPVIDAYKPGIDRTLIAASLKLTVQQRLENLMRMQVSVAELRRAGVALVRKRLVEGKDPLP